MPHQTLKAGIVHRRSLRNIATALASRFFKQALTLIALLIAATAQAGTMSSPPENTDATAALVVVAEPAQLSSRLRELTFTSTALAPVVATAKVRVLLPEDYDSDNPQRYPVLYLYHGGMSDHSSWTEPEKGDAAVLTRDFPLIVVMPDGGAAGYYTDWYNNGKLGAPQWETFHIAQLIPWIDGNFRTIPQRWARASAGASMGGHGALSYAAKHPDLFGVAAAFSGAVDLSHPGLGIKSHGDLANQIFGSYRDHEIRWRGNSATDLAASLSGTDVSLYIGDQGEVEKTIAESNQNLYQRLEKQHRPHRMVVNPGQGHTWGNFRMSLADWLPHLHEQLQEKPDPSGFIYSSISKHYEHYGWSVTLHRTVTEFSSLQAGGRGAFILTGSGGATVITPELGKPGETVDIAMNDHSGPTVTQMQLDASGRLSIQLNLGPENPHQQLTADADSASTGESRDKAPFYRRGNGSRFFSASVAISPVQP